MMTYLLLGDCAEKMRDLADNSIDAIVTDAPYGLAFMGAKWDNFGGKSCGNDSAEVRREKAQEYAAKNSGAPRYANGHGGAPTLDAMRNFQAAMTPIFAEALRVAKPGAHLLAFGGTRTYHRLACAIEDAGWEVRDCIMYVHSQGFPKGQNVGKQVEALLKHDKTNSRKEFAPETEAAKAWEGWNTQLKPACEPIVVARKPLDGTGAANVLKYGTGALNIDGCRVGTGKMINPPASNNRSPSAKGIVDFRMKASVAPTEAIGRFPANLIHDGSDEVLALFPDSKGALAPVYGKLKNQKSHTGDRGIYNHYEMRDEPMFPRGDFGSAARFFYCAKASRSERGEGNLHPTVKPLALMRYLVRLVCRKGGIVLDPFMGSGTTGVAARLEGMHFVGIEREPHYYEIAERRISAVKPEPPTQTQQELAL